ncbi:MAG TPA: sulfotransferase domain-containing protein [Wenzhouxiangellaceae bacterium]|nr:sulfotransferase domain-containing protein [Wenzhouxiangellaceae bacterium]
MAVDLDQPAPHFFIVGAPKCGTTSMAQYLNQHPDVFVVRGEPHFFGSDLDYNSPRLTPDQYQALCRNTGGKPVCGDRSTWYLYSRNAAREIHAYNPHALIIAMLRNPAEMLHSLHAHHFQRGLRDDIEHFEDALAAEPDRRRGNSIPANVRFPESLYYSEIARYSEQLERYFDLFGREHVRIILFDDLKSSPDQVYADTLEFLGVDSAFEPDFGIHNASAPTPDSWAYRAWKASTLRYRIRSLAPQRLYDAIRAKRKKRLEQAARRRPRASLDPAVRAALADRFTDEIGRLEKLIGRDLSNWRAR